MIFTRGIYKSERRNKINYLLRLIFKHSSSNSSEKTAFPAISLALHTKSYFSTNPFGTIPKSASFTIVISNSLSPAAMM